jgi:hypothetical protein
MLRGLGHWAIKANDADAIASALDELHGRWQRDDLADSGAPSPYTSAAATSQIIGLVQERLKPSYSG